MAAAVENSTRVRTVFGNWDVEAVNVTFTNNGDTFTSEFAGILGVQFEPTSATTVGFTISGKVATLVSSGTVTGWLLAYADNT